MLQWHKQLVTTYYPTQLWPTLMVKTLFRVRKSLWIICTLIHTWVICLANKSLNKNMQRFNAAKKSPAGRTVRRAMEMLLKQTPAAPGYNALVVSGRKANNKKKNKKTSPGPAISMCVGKMLHAGINTFGQFASGCCIPDGNVASSVRAFVKRQFTVTIGENKIGWALFFAPLHNDGVCIVHTTGSYIGTTAQWLNANQAPAGGLAVRGIGTTLTGSMLSTGHSSVDDKAAFAARHVALGYTFRYTGTELDRAGQAYAYSHPAHACASGSFNGGTEDIYGIDDLSGFPETLIVECSREETHVPLFPITEAELEYSNEDGNTTVELKYPWSQGADVQSGGFTYQDASGTRVGVPIHVFMVTGTPGSEYTLVYGQHTEVIGQGVNGYAKIPPESDPVGVRDLQAAFSRFNLDRAREAGVNPVPEFRAAFAKVQSGRNNRMNL